jgi:hypothetical protein
LVSGTGERGQASDDGDRVEMPLAESARLAFWTRFLGSPEGAKAPPF